MLNNQLRRQLLERHKQSGFPGSIIDVYKAYEQGIDIISNFEQQQMQQQMQVAQTPQQQQEGLRPFHQAGNTNQSMVFPNVPANQPFNTVGMKAPINIKKFDNQGHLVKSYENVPPGIENLPTGPNEGTVIETPANMQSGGFKPAPRIGARENPDGTQSTHLYATETLDGKNWVSFPTLFQNPDSSWVDMSKGDWYPAYEEALKRGEVLDFGRRKNKALKWGEGSWKDSMQSGGQLAPIYTDNLKDPALIAYNDSLNLHNAMLMQDLLMGPNPKSAPSYNMTWTPQQLREYRTPQWNSQLQMNISLDWENEREMMESLAGDPSAEANQKLIEYYKSLGFTDADIMYHTSPDVVHPTIRAIGTYHDGEAYSPIYKKPTQPIIYRELSELTPKQPPKSQLDFNKSLQQFNRKPVTTRPPQTIYKQDPSVSTGQYPIGERIWDPTTKTWKTSMWDVEMQKDSRELAIPRQERWRTIEVPEGGFQSGGKRKYQSGSSPEEADKIYTRLNSPIDPSTTNLLDPAYVYGDTQNKFFKPTEDPERLRVREILGEPLKALAYYSYDSNRKRGRPTRAEWDAFGRSNAIDQALSLYNPFQIVNDAATSQAAPLSVLPDIGKPVTSVKKALKNAPKNLLEDITNQVFKKKYYPDVDFKSMSAAQRRAFFRNQEQLEAEDAVKSGAEWLEDWINHPATKQRILNVTTPSEYIPYRAPQELLLNYPNLIKPIKGMSLNPTYNVTQTPREFLLNYPKLFEGTKHAETLGIIPISRKTFDKLPKDLQSAPIHGVSRRHNREAREISPWSKQDVNTYVIDPRAPTKRPNNRLSDNLHALLTSRARAINKSILTTIHEGTHDWANDQVIEDIIKNTSTPNPWGVVVDQSSNIFARHLSPETLDILQKGNNRHIKYLAEPTEIYARVMELRRMMNIRPGQIVTADDVAKMVSKNEKTKYIDPKFFEIFAGKGADKNKNIAELFNVLPATIVGGVGVGIMGANSNAKQENSPSEVLSPSTGLKAGGFKYPRYPKKVSYNNKRSN